MAQETIELVEHEDPALGTVYLVIDHQQICENGEPVMWEVTASEYHELKQDMGL